MNLTEQNEAMERWINTGPLIADRSWTRCLETAHRFFEEFAGPIDPFDFLALLNGRGICRSDFGFWAIDCIKIARERALERGHLARIA